jgi:5'-nucleotidase
VLQELVVRRGAVVLVLASLLCLGVLAGCSSSGSDAASDPRSGPASTAPRTTVAPSSSISVLVTNDDGYAADGIDAVVVALRKVPGVSVTVVAPKDNKSGTGKQTTPGRLAVTDVETRSGYPAKAVDGFPGDAVRVALDQLGVKPDLVVAGINQGQNLGPVVDLSGTVNAARTAARRGIPALAASAGLGSPVDYAAAVPMVLDWVESHRDLKPRAAVPTIDNLNVPSCAKGKVRGLAKVPVSTSKDTAAALAASDCTSTASLSSLPDDVVAFRAGYATLDAVPVGT